MTKKTVQSPATHFSFVRTRWDDVGIVPYIPSVMAIHTVGTTMGRPFGCAENMRTDYARPYPLTMVCVSILMLTAIPRILDNTPDRLYSIYIR